MFIVQFHFVILKCICFSIYLTSDSLHFLNLWLCPSILENSHPLIQLQVFFCFFLSSPFGTLIMYMQPFCNRSTVLEYSIPSFSFYSLRFSFGSVYWNNFKLIDFFLSYVQSNDEPIKGSLHFCYSVLFFLPFPFDSFTEFPSLCLNCPSVLAYCLFFPLEPCQVFS